MRSQEQIEADAADERAFSNRTAYDIWADRYCYQCVHDDPEVDRCCPILGVALLGRWPREWTRRRHRWEAGGACGSYEVVDVCTEFVERDDDDGGGEPEPDPGPPPECDGQLDIVDAYLDTAIGELSRQPVRHAVPAL